MYKRNGNESSNGPRWSQSSNRDVDACSRVGLYVCSSLSSLSASPSVDDMSFRQAVSSAAQISLHFSLASGSTSLPASVCGSVSLSSFFVVFHRRGNCCFHLCCVHLFLRHPMECHFGLLHRPLFGCQQLDSKLASPCCCYVRLCFATVHGL